MALTAPLRTPRAADWQRAAAFVRAEKRPGDLVIFAPAWVGSHRPPPPRRRRHHRRGGAHGRRPLRPALRGVGPRRPRARRPARPGVRRVRQRALRPRDGDASTSSRAPRWSTTSSSAGARRASRAGAASARRRSARSQGTRSSARASATTTWRSACWSPTTPPSAASTSSPSSAPQVRLTFTATLGRTLAVRTGLHDYHQRKIADGRVLLRVLVDGVERRADLAGLERRLEAPRPRHRGPGRAGPRGDLRGLVAEALRAALLLRGGGAAMSGRSGAPRRPRRRAGGAGRAAAAPRRARRRGATGSTALGLGLAVFAVLVAAQRIEGVSRDEAYYFKAGEQYFGWFGGLWDNLRAGRPGRSFTQADIARHFSYNHEHPPVAKVLFGFSWRVVPPVQLPEAARHHSAWRAPSRPTACRPAPCRACSWGSSTSSACASSRGGGAVVAAVLTAAMPHPFFHSQIATFDQPINVLWFATAYAYWRSLTSRRWAIVAGIVLGFALGTKHNAWFLPLLLGLHWLAALARVVARRPRAPQVLVDPVDGRARAARLLPALAVAVAPDVAALPRVRALPPPPRLLQHRVPGAELEHAAVPVALPARRDRADGAGDDARARARRRRARRARADRALRARRAAARRRGRAAAGARDIGAGVARREAKASPTAARCCCRACSSALLAIFPLALFMTGRRRSSAA